MDLVLTDGNVLHEPKRALGVMAAIIVSDDGKPLMFFADVGGNIITKCSSEKGFTESIKALGFIDRDLKV